MAESYRIQDIGKLVGRDIFFDANILIYLFWPTGSYSPEAKYAEAFRKLLKQGNSLNVDFNIISEIVNRIIRIEYQKKASTISFKDFRESEEGKEALSDLYTIIDQTILPNFNITEKLYSKDEVRTFLKVDSLDFVDKGTVSICSQNSYVLLTNDKDFKDSGVDILTANSRILNS
ncbi:twitching motility protein PilT [Sphingobacterium sp. 18053]|uniref:twitching motility protein PilT n=1 Tax=Sphingobacterium sp. 18053 TaxID=2681401 RepID=UPI00135BEA03|nr:twitching motility protein PilT [Sphingobacterium sp. 18053]